MKLGLLDLARFSEERGLTNKRETEKEGTRFLMDRLFENSSPGLLYSTENKPFLSDRSWHISISHSHNKLAILAGKSLAGVDIELIRDKVLRIRHKFLSEEELQFAGENIEKLITLWAAKEALYKEYGKKELDFIQNIKISPFTENQIEFTGSLHLTEMKKSYKLQRRKIENYILVFTLGEI